MNARIQRIKAMACGYRNRERFRNAIFSPSGAGFLPEACLSPNDFLKRQLRLARDSWTD